MARKPQYPKISDVPEVQALYEQMRQRGTSHTLAEMFALRSPPGTRFTEKAFLEGRKMNMDDPVDRLAVQRAHAAGISTQGKVYIGGLADGRGPADPAAWVSSADDVLAVAKRRQLKVEGALRYDPGPVQEKEPKYKIAPDIMRRLMRKYRKDPKYKKKSRKELKEIIEANHAPKIVE